jgi:hypothetical protein
MNFENDNQNQFYDGMNNSYMKQDSCVSQANNCVNPVYECPEERVCHRYICYDVPHIKPCNTRIINHHIYRHSFVPTYSCCEENVVENVFERKCC